MRCGGEPAEPDRLLPTQVRYLDGLLEWLDQQDRDVGSPLCGNVDMTRIGAAGHSRGAKLACLQFAGSLFPCNIQPYQSCMCLCQTSSAVPAGTYLRGLPGTPSRCMACNTVVCRQSSRQSCISGGPSRQHRAHPRGRRLSQRCQGAQAAGEACRYQRRRHRGPVQPGGQQLPGALFWLDIPLDLRAAAQCPACHAAACLLC